MLIKVNGNDTVLARPAEDYDRLDHDDVRMFCHWKARYMLPTLELVDFLKRFIGDHSALEICAGCGDLGRQLGIRMVDNHQQTWDDVKAFYKITQQPTIDYGADVENMDAIEAVKKYQPDIVIGSWVTHWIDPDLPPPPGGGNMYGVKEDEIIKLCKYYVLIGAEEIHKYKKIMSLPHETIDATFVRSRRTDNRIWIWKGEKGG